MQMQGKEKEPDFNFVCILPYESALKKLYFSDQYSFEQFMRVLIELLDVNVHFIIYTNGNDHSEVHDLLKACGQSRFFIPKDDIFDITKMNFLGAKDNRKFAFINYAITHHNRYRPGAAITPAQVKESVFVLDEDIAYVKTISNPKRAQRYHGILIEDNLAHITLLESIYTSLINVEKYSKQQQANALFNLVRSQHTLFVDDQEYLFLNYQKRIRSINSGVAEGMLCLAKKMSSYLCMVAIFETLDEKTRVDINNNYRVEVAKIIDARIAKFTDESSPKDIVEGLVQEFHASRPLIFSGDEAELDQWQKLSDSICICVIKYFEARSKKIVSEDRQQSYDNGLLPQSLLQAFCVRQLNFVAIGLADIHKNELTQTSHHAQKSNSNTYYWLVTECEAKEAKILEALSLYEPLVQQRVAEEVAVLEGKNFTLVEMYIYYEKKSQETLNALHEVLDRIGCRESELHEQSNQQYLAAKQLSAQALFQSTVMPPSSPAAAKTTNGAHPNGFFSALGTKAELTTRSRVLGVQGAASTFRISREVSTKKMDLFDLCRIGDATNFEAELNSKLSVPYDQHDISLLLRAKVNYMAGYAFLLNTLVYKHECPIFLMPPIGHYPNSKFNIAKYIDKSPEEASPAKKDLFEELQSLFSKQSKLVVRLLFAYQDVQKENVPWMLGDIKIEKNENQYHVVLSSTNPYGVGKFNDSDYQILCESLTRQIIALDSSAKITCTHQETMLSPSLPKDEKFSSGIVVTDMLMNTIKRQPVTTQNGSNTLVVNLIRTIHIEWLKLNIKENDPDLVRFLDRHFYTNYMGIRRKTLLETALQHGHDALVGCLVDLPVDVTFSGSGYPPIFSALLGTKKYPTRRLLLYILQGATNMSSTGNHSVKQFNVVDLEGNPVLHVAVNHGVPRPVETLVKWGIEHPGTLTLYSKNKSDRTAFHEALCTSKYGKLCGTLEVLFNYGLGQSATTIEKLHVDTDVQPDMLRFVIYLLEQRLERAEKMRLTQPPPPLQRMRTGSGIIESPRSGRGRSGSIISMFNLTSPRTTYEWKDKNSQLYAENKFPSLMTDLNCTDELGFAPIHVICICGKIESLDELIARKVKLNIATEHLVPRKTDGKDDAPELATKLTPLHLAILCQKKCTEFVRKLLAAPGVEILPDSKGCTALHYAVGRDTKSVELILQHLEKSKLLEIAKLPAKDGVTALGKAMLNGNKETIDLFIKVGVWPSDDDMEYVAKQITDRDNKQQIKDVICQIFADLTMMYRHELKLLSGALQQSKSSGPPLVRK